MSNEGAGGDRRPRASSSELKAKARGPKKSPKLTKADLSSKVDAPKKADELGLVDYKPIDLDEDDTFPIEGLMFSKKCVDSELGKLEKAGYKLEELERHIEMLHEYNDIKDIGQSLLGRIAAIRGTTTRDLYSHFGLELDD